MSNEITLPETLEQAILKFADPMYAHDVAVSFVWPDGEPTCHHCGKKNAHFMEKYLRFRCRDCRKDFTVKNGTIFEDSPLPLSKWMAAMWMICNDKNGVSSYEIHRAIGVTQKTAWFMLHRIREAMRTGTFQKIHGEAEADETYVGGKELNKHRTRSSSRAVGPVGKAVVMGVLERGAGTRKSTVRAMVVKNNKMVTLTAQVRRYVEAGSWLYTDTHQAYKYMHQEYAHRFVDHTTSYAQGAVHTNGLENFWSLLKRGLKGTYVSVMPFHLERYVDEQAWRFNNRQYKDGERFAVVMASVSGKRLDYATLTTAFERHRDEFGI